MNIKQVKCVSGLTGFYYDDLPAIQQGAEREGLIYVGDPITEGYQTIRQPGESVSVMLFLSDGTVVYGDCSAVTYSGIGGRDPVFIAETYIPVINQEVIPHLHGRELEQFRSLAEEIDQLNVNGCPLHTAIRFGVTQAILEATAFSKRMTMMEVICEEWNLPVIKKRIPIGMQTGDLRYENAEKAIIKNADVLPHGNFNSVKAIGSEGSALLKYANWLKQRINTLGTPDYHPIVHFDVYGMLDIAFGQDLQKITEYLRRLEAMCQPYRLRVECPLLRNSKPDQIAAMAALKELLETQNVQVEIIADEWCNTLQDIQEFIKAGAADLIQIKMPDLGGINNVIEAILYCKANHIGGYLGGSCNETTKSAQISAHIALATQADQILAKPGMGVDEALMIISNEMSRTLVRISI